MVGHIDQLALDSTARLGKVKGWRRLDQDRPTFATAPEHGAVEQHGAGTSMA
ncbi:MAG TPA: hypothetical protein VFS21_11450 [Roseiflexaceae bacterium]|nr:hypothetical protein [Roseiflexaceae bacterium]